MASRKRRACENLTLVQRVRELSTAASITAPEPSYLDRPHLPAPPLISERQREKVVKYINELAEDFELCVQTGTLACNYFDRFVARLSARPATPPFERRHIQMIASTCLLIAAKFSDRKLPPLSELEKVHHGRATADEFAQLELRILEGLGWKLHVPLPHVFLGHLKELCANAPFTAQMVDRMLFFIDLSVYGYHFLAYSAATIAAAAMLTAWKFSEEHECVTRYIEVLAHAVDVPTSELSGCVNALVKYYASCFPESAERTRNGALFIPIPNHIKDEATSASPTPVRPPDTPTSDAGSADAADADAERAGGASSVPPPTEAATGMAATAAVGGDKRPTPDPQRATPESIMEVGLVEVGC